MMTVVGTGWSWSLGPACLRGESYEPNRVRHFMQRTHSLSARSPPGDPGQESRPGRERLQLSASPGGTARGPGPLATVDPRPPVDAGTREGPRPQGRRPG